MSLTNFLKIGSGVPELEDPENGISHWNRFNNAALPHRLWLRCRVYI